ncbi:hypothetical protein BLOT_005006 [Blomia tropicalis]|nr:hypothetical protein BLOT_005006 [Blomia tropicalis]
MFLPENPPTRIQRHVKVSTNDLRIICLTDNNIIELLSYLQPSISHRFLILIVFIDRCKPSSHSSSDHPITSITEGNSPRFPFMRLNHEIDSTVTIGLLNVH